MLLSIVGDEIIYMVFYSHPQDLQLPSTKLEEVVLLY